jgi:hypothetical protein
MKESFLLFMWPFFGIIESLHIVNVFICHFCICGSVDVEKGIRNRKSENSIPQSTKGRLWGIIFPDIPLYYT